MKTIKISQEDKFFTKLKSPIEIKLNDFYDSMLIINENYFLLKSDLIDTLKINIKLSNVSEIKDVLNILRNYKEDTNKSVCLTDNLNIFRGEIKYKYKLDMKNVVAVFNNIVSKRKNQNINDIPKELLYKSRQIFDLVINEINQINTNHNYLHFVQALDNNPFNLLVNMYVKNTLIQFIIKIDDRLYPYVPYEFKYLSPRVKPVLLYNLMNLNIFKIENWNPIITLEQFIILLEKKLEPIFKKFICKENNKYDNLLVELLFLTKDVNFDNLNIDLNINSFNLKNKFTSKKLWTSGTGYGHSGSNKWDISKFIDNKKKEQDELFRIMKEISINIDQVMLSDKNHIILKFIIGKLKSCNILVINENFKFYQVLVDILNVIKKSLSLDKINEIYLVSKDIIEELEILISSHQPTSITSKTNVHELFEFYQRFLKSILWFKSNSKIEIINKTYVDNKNEYTELVKKHNFGNYNFNVNHIYHKMVSKNKNMGAKTLMRIASEVSTLKKSLPINWDTSILVRVCPNHINALKFIIIGPEDTPYHNGIFEFHAYFPENYPNVPPKVNIETTDMAHVRFNPNLYASGKVCLSLLGTWRGEKSESWNSDTSTFLQVLISIQSLILVKDPYYNEPGWESDRFTEKGRKKCFDYSDNIRYETLRVAINNQIKNPPDSFREFIFGHFKAKKEELLKITEKWVNESEKKKKEMILAREEMIELLEDL